MVKHGVKVVLREFLVEFEIFGEYVVKITEVFLLEIKI